MMKKATKWLWLLLLSFFLLPISKGQSVDGGIAFFDGTIQSAFFEAQDQGKLVFVETSAKWCGPL